MSSVRWSPLSDADVRRTDVVTTRSYVRSSAARSAPPSSSGTSTVLTTVPAEPRAGRDLESTSVRMRTPPVSAWSTTQQSRPSAEASRRSSPSSRPPTAAGVIPRWSSPVSTEVISPLASNRISAIGPCRPTPSGGFAPRRAERRGAGRDTQGASRRARRSPVTSAGGETSVRCGDVRRAPHPVGGAGSSRSRLSSADRPRRWRPVTPTWRGSPRAGRSEDRGVRGRCR